MTDAPGPKAADADRIAQGYQVDGAALEFGTVVLDGNAYPQARIRVPLSMVNRHGLIAGATGTGKTKTLQGLAEQLSAAGVFDEAHLLFDGASKAFLDAVTQTVRLIRSKGAVFFVTQNPQDLPDAVLGQLGNRVQHALRALTPDDASALARRSGPIRRRPTTSSPTRCSTSAPARRSSPCCRCLAHRHRWPGRACDPRVR